VSLPVVTTEIADEDIRRIDSWWRENRSAAPDLFREELAECFAGIAQSPRIGHTYKSRRVLGVRRFLLRSTRHHVYYVIEPARVIVLGVWSSVRGRGPALGRP
jgi:plasmid stabilization system protein ParE